METKRIISKIKYKEFLIIFAYRTVKTGKYKEQERLIRATDKESAKKHFKIWADSIRTMDNVEILSISKTDSELRIIEI